MTWKTHYFQYQVEYSGGGKGFFKELFHSNIISLCDVISHINNTPKLYAKKLLALSGRLQNTLEMKAMLVFFIYNQMIKKCIWTDLKIINENKIMITVFFFYGFLL